MRPILNSQWRHRFAVLTAAATLALLGVGGLVTSHGVGMAVPDWPNTYGYNMFFFPVSRWVGGIFYEHTHRLAASAVGLMTTILAVWLYGTSARPFLRWTGAALLAAGLATAGLARGHAADAFVLAVAGLAAFGASFFWPRCEPSPRWLRRLGLAAFFAVVLQGVLGGLRVALIKDQIGIFHATLAQLFFVLVCALAFLTRSTKAEGRNPREASKSEDAGEPALRTSDFGLLSDFDLRPSDLTTLRRLFLVTTLLILCQLILGATMRHQHAGLAIPDFPLAYGKLWPAMDPAVVAHYNQQRMEVTEARPITAFQIGLQMAHRFLAFGIAIGVAVCAGSACRRLGTRAFLSRSALAWLGLILAQVLLGAATIWSNKAADIATAHVVVGALALALGAIQCIMLYPHRPVAETPRESATVFKVENCKWQTAN